MCTEVPCMHKFLLIYSTTVHKSIQTLVMHSNSWKCSVNGGSPISFFMYIIHAQWDTEASANVAANLVISLVTQRSGETWTSHSQHKMHFSLGSLFCAHVKDNPSVTAQCSGGSSSVGPFPYTLPLDYGGSVPVLPNPVPSSVCDCLNAQNHLGSDVCRTWDCMKCSVLLLPRSL